MQKPKVITSPWEITEWCKIERYCWGEFRVVEIDVQVGGIVTWWKGHPEWPWLWPQVQTERCAPCGKAWHHHGRKIMFRLAKWYQESVQTSHVYVVNGVSWMIKPFQCWDWWSWKACKFKHQAFSFWPGMHASCACFKSRPWEACCVLFQQCTKTKTAPATRLLLLPNYFPLTGHKVPCHCPWLRSCQIKRSAGKARSVMHCLVCQVRVRPVSHVRSPPSPKASHIILTDFRGIPLTGMLWVIHFIWPQETNGKAKQTRQPLPICSLQNVLEMLFIRRGKRHKTDVWLRNNTKLKVYMKR